MASKRSSGEAYGTGGDTYLNNWCRQISGQNRMKGDSFFDEFRHIVVDAPAFFRYIPIYSLTSR